MSKITLPLLRVRSEFSFRKVYGKVSRVADRLAELSAPFAGMVDSGGTWGHVAWQRELLKRGIEPGFGAEFVLPIDDRKPIAWALADDTRALYRLTSSQPTTPEEFGAATGVIRFAGTALTDPDHFDYIDINPASTSASLAAIQLSKTTGKPLVITPANDYPAPSDRGHYLAWNDDAKPTLQHLPDADELRAAMPYLNDDQWAAAVRATQEVAERLQGRRLPSAPIISVPGDLAALVADGKAARLAAGQIAAWTADYQARMDREMAMIRQKGFESYFIVVADLVAWSKKRMLVGPARGSSAGSLVCYLLGITEVDPLPHGLLFERFIDINRADLPDIDIDFNDQKRHLCFEYLAEKYGRDNVARIGSISTLRPRSVMAHVGKKLGIPHGATFPVLNVLIEYSSGDSRFGKGLEDTLNSTRPGQEFLERYPEAAIMGELENHASHTGVHAAGIIVSNEPVIDYCTVIDGVAQVDKKGAEELNLLKIDVLGLRTLGVIEDAGVVTAEELYSLPLNDPEVFKIFNEGKFSGVFQFEGAAQRSVSIKIPIRDFETIDHITALARPGPLGSGAANHYTLRAAGAEEVVYRHPSMADYLKETKGVVLYQEQVMRISFEIGRFSWEVVSEIRKAMSGSKGQEYFNRRGAEFVEGAATVGLDAKAAEEIWSEICTFGGWGMNKSHTTSYAIISYWCAWMKRYHPLEYAAACLRNAKDDEQTVEILRELNAEGIDYVPFDPFLSEANWAAKDGKLVGGFSNLVGIGPVKSAALIAKRDGAGLTEADLKKLAAMKIKVDDLHPAHTKWGHIYRDPDAHGVNGPVRQLADLKDGDVSVVLCRLVKKERRDRNEAALVAKRGGKVEGGETRFLDLFMVDDSVSKPMRVRIGQRSWSQFGQAIADGAIDGEDWFLIRGKWFDLYDMLSVNKIKCLNRPELI